MQVVSVRGPRPARGAVPLPCRHWQDAGCPLSGSVQLSLVGLVAGVRRGWRVGPDRVGCDWVWLWS